MPGAPATRGLLWSRGMESVEAAVSEAGRLSMDCFAASAASTFVLVKVRFGQEADVRFKACLSYQVTQFDGVVVASRTTS